MIVRFTPSASPGAGGFTLLAVPHPHPEDGGS